MRISENCLARASRSNKVRKSTYSNLLKPSLVALAVAHSMSIATADAATIHVGGSDGSGCDLIGAIIAANTDSTSPDNSCVAGSGSDTIELLQDITLTEPWQGTSRGLPLVTSTITFNGNGHIISRDANAENFGFIGISGRGYIGSVNDVTLMNAAAPASDPEMATVINGAYELNNVEIINNSGAKLVDNDFSNWYLTVIDSRFENNRGTAISFNPTGFPYLDIQNTVITNNSGRAIDLLPNRGDFPTVTIGDSQISNNTADECVGFSAEANTLFLSIDNSTISNNTALNNGGAICLYDIPIYEGNYAFSLTLTNSTLSDNTAGGDGGAIFTYSKSFASVIVENSTVSNNSAAESGGAFAFLSFGPFTRFLSGYVPSVSYEVDTRAELNSVHSTIVGNSANNGGAIYTGDKGIVSLNLTNSIIAGNSATVAGSEIYNLSQSAFPADATVVSNNNVLGSSLESSFQAFSGFSPSATDITTTIDGNSPAMLDEIVGDLQDNGGATRTHALPIGSPAIDAGDLDVCINQPINALDQRGETRGEAGLCDIGAYELLDIISGLASISVDSVEVSEGDRKATLTLSLSSPQTERIPVDFQTVNGTATDGLDYTGRFGTMTFAPGQTQKVRILQLTDDNLSEATESFRMLLSNPVGATLEQAVGTITILDDDGLPTIRIKSANHSVKEGGSGSSRTIVFTVTLSSPQTERVSVDFQTVDETAIGDVDYQIRSGSMTFMPGQTSKIRAVKVLGDTEPENDETFRLVLNNPSINAVVDLEQANLVGTIIDDDNNALPKISIESADHSVNEGDSDNTREIVYTITLSSPQTEQVSVDYQTIDQSAVGGMDYESRSGSMTFMPGQVSKLRTIKVLNDFEAEADETFRFVLSNPSDNAVIDVEDANTIGTIIDNDNDNPLPKVSITSQRSEFYEGNIGVPFLIEMTSPTTEYVTVYFETRDVTAVAGEDYIRRSGAVGFRPGQVSKPISINLIGDTEIEPDETFKVVLTSSSDNALIDPNQSERVMTILNNDR
ncbi:hypothetical protein N9060_00420 [Arenicella sp.]|nr:hypothetical protein [Arenicella sp.]